MAKEHFDSRGYPIFSKIVGPMVNFVENLTIAGGMDGKIDIVNPSGAPYTDKYVTKYVKPVGDLEIGSKPVKITGVYVVGSQAQRLPESYKTTSDLDLVVQTNLEDIVTEAKSNQEMVLYQLGKMLNNGMADWRTRPHEDKPYSIDFFEVGNPRKKRIDAPHLQVYPTLRKVVATEAPLSQENIDWLSR